MKYEEAMQEYLDEVKITRSSATHLFYVNQDIALKRYFEGVDIEDIKRKDIVSYIHFENERNPNKTNGTINKHIMAFKAMYHHATGNRFQFSKLPETNKIIKVINRRTINKVFAYLKKRADSKDREGLRNYVLFKLLLDTGLRINEALHLKVTDIDFSGNIIHVMITKTKTERYVFFTDETKRLLVKLMTKHKLNEYLFINYISNKPLSGNNIQLLCRRMRKTLNLNRSITPHKWRHTFATNFLSKGGNLETLRMILGHTSLKTTQKYLHLDKRSLKSEYFRINKLTDHYED